VSPARGVPHTGLVRRATVLIAAVCLAVAGGGTWLALGASGHSAAQVAAGPAAGATSRPAVPMPPIPTARPKVVEPVAGEAGAEGAGTPAATDPADAGPDPRPRGPASTSHARGGGPAAGASDGVTGATALPNGIALVPLEAPEPVRRIIEAGNEIARTPYKWGGGHGKWKDTGYDCSGSVSYALSAAGMLDAPLASGPLMKWGKPGKGKWITVYSSPGHVFMEVAGIRFDTSGARTTGSRWQNGTRPTSGFAVRHFPGY
jgi:hypothetical protein